MEDFFSNINFTGLLEQWIEFDLPENYRAFSGFWVWQVSSILMSYAWPIHPNTLCM